MSENSSSAQNVENVEDIDLSMLGDIQQVTDGGFSFRPISGYDLDISGGIVNMTAPGSDPDVGSLFQLMGWKNEDEMTIDPFGAIWVGGSGGMLQIVP